MIKKYKGEDHTNMQIENPNNENIESAEHPKSDLIFNKIMSFLQLFMCETLVILTNENICQPLGRNLPLPKLGHRVIAFNLAAHKSVFVN